MVNLKRIPAIDDILLQEQVENLLAIYNRKFVVDMARKSVDELRQELLSITEEIDKPVLMHMILDKLEINVNKAMQGTLRKVVNGTGVVLHTNLGRAPLGEAALKYLIQMGAHYNNLEMNLETGERGSRYSHVEDILIRITGAEAVLVVNNNAAAVLLALACLAKDREVIVSRGQLVEIGGAFRIPEVMKLSGANLIEVGTTNKTYPFDYEMAISEQTALLFAAHTSNYKIVGFSQEVQLSELVELGQKHHIPVMQDLGSGIVYDMGNWGLKDEPTVQECVKAGADVITFSGDKLLGGPQAGIIIGKKRYIEAMKKNQLTRALRVDKLTIASLEATLLAYLGGNPQAQIPVISMLTINLEELKKKANQLFELLCGRPELKDYVEHLQVVELEDMVGGGAYPTYKLPGFGVEIGFTHGHLEAAAKRLRLMNPALVTRKKEEKMLISVRTLLPGDEQIVVNSLAQVLNS